MNMEPTHEDLRTRRTRKLLREALIGLLRERDLEAISVKDICERAMIHRTTFYKHYVDKYDLLDREMTRLFWELSEGIPTPAQTIGAYASGDAPEHFVRLFQLAAENPDLYGAMLASGRASAFGRLVDSYLVEQTQTRIRALASQRRGPASPVPEDLLVQFSIGAVTRVITWWLEQKDRPSPVEMARHIARMLAYGILPGLGIGGGR